MRKNLRDEFQYCFGSSADHAQDLCGCAVQKEALAMIDSLAEALTGLLDDKSTTYAVRASRARAALLKALPSTPDVERT